MNASRVLALTLAILVPGALAAGCGPSGHSHDHGSGTGLAAGTFLDAPALVVEVDHVADHPPSSAALGLLRQRLLERCRGTVDVVVDDGLARRTGDAAERPWTLADLQALEAARRDVAGPAGARTIYVVLVDGVADASLGQGAIGWAFGPSSLAVFADQLRDAAPIAGGDAEGWVMTHEAGHLLGLVGHGTPQVRQHEDLARRGHCTQRECVMRYAADAQHTDFCAYCKEDLAAAGGR